MKGGISSPPTPLLQRGEYGKLMMKYSRKSFSMMREMPIELSRWN